MDINNLLLGDKVLFFYHLDRKMEVREHPNPKFALSPTQQWRVWKNVPAIDGKSSLSGIVVGVRTLRNGIVDFSTYGPHPEISFEKKETIKAVLVSYNLHRKPVFVLPEHLIKLAKWEPTSPYKSGDVVTFPDGSKRKIN